MWWEGARVSTGPSRAAVWPGPTWCSGRQPATAVETFEQPGDYVELEEPEEPTHPEEPELPTDSEKPVDQKDPASPGELPSAADPAGAYMAAVAVAGAVALGAAAVCARKRVLS